MPTTQSNPQSTWQDKPGISESLMSPLLPRFQKQSKKLRAFTLNCKLSQTASRQRPALWPSKVSCHNVSRKCSPSQKIEAPIDFGRKDSGGQHPCMRRSCTAPKPATSNRATKMRAMRRVARSEAWRMRAKRSVASCPAAPAADPSMLG